MEGEGDDLYPIAILIDELKVRPRFAPRLRVRCARVQLLTGCARDGRDGENAASLEPCRRMPRLSRP